MKFFSNALVAFGLAAVALGQDLKVPGDSPVEFCNANRENDILQIEKLDISPNPPMTGQPLNLTLSGDLKKTITPGAYVKVTVEVASKPLITTTAGLCDQTAEADLACPIEAGKVAFTKSFNLPSVIPDGTYTVLADAYTVDNEEITCLKATVTFPPPN